MKRCAKCGKSISSYRTTAYGEIRCLDCFDDYLMTDKGKVEYFIGLCTGKLKMKDYDADFLGHVAVCWNKYKEQLNISIQQIMAVEEKAECMGIL